MRFKDLVPGVGFGVPGGVVVFPGSRFCEARV